MTMPHYSDPQKTTICSGSETSTDITHGGKELTTNSCEVQTNRLTLSYR